MDTKVAASLMGVPSRPAPHLRYHSVPKPRRVFLSHDREGVDVLPAEAATEWSRNCKAQLRLVGQTSTSAPDLQVRLQSE